MHRFLRHVARRQQRIAYAVICLMLLLLAEALARKYGLLTVLALWIGLVVPLEFFYRSFVSFEARNRRKWWARQRKNVPGFRIYVFLGLLVLRILIESPFARYSLLALLAGGLICAGIIRVVHRTDEYQ
jgi:hypothetical protein